jgi:hypothetical protein
VADEVAEKAGRKSAKRKPRGKPFQPGQSGNPNGKRPGTRHKATILAQALVDGQVEALVNKGLELALGGDVTMLRTMLGFILPARKDRYVAMGLPTLRSAEDALEASRLVVAAIADGRLTPAEGGELTRAIETAIKLLETVSLEQRLVVLEQERGLHH